MRPTLFTYDIFGTVLDWRRGLTEAVAARGMTLSLADFERVIDHQGADEQRAFRPYREITARSLVAVLGLDGRAADELGATVGDWPLYPDSKEGLASLMKVAPCVAMTNSDRAHRPQVEAQLGFSLSHWFCAEELGLYKPSPDFWRAVANKLDRPLDRSWWHVSAYADYDLDVARSLGLTAVYIPRAHARPGAHDVTAPDLVALAALINDLKTDSK